MRSLHFADNLQYSRRRIHTTHRFVGDGDGNGGVGGQVGDFAEEHGGAFGAGHEGAGGDFVVVADEPEFVGFAFGRRLHAVGEEVPLAGFGVDEGAAEGFGLGLAGHLGELDVRETAAGGVEFLSQVTQLGVGLLEIRLRGG